MEIITCIKDAKELSKKFKTAGQTISLVPTMGKLHEGHLSIVKNALKYGKVFVSIYVNPLQFGPSEDFNNYPRDIEGDIEKLRRLNVDCVYLPDDTITKNNKTFIIDDFFSNKLCGLYRPGHFQGVLTIVMKLLLIVQPDFAFFGLKDYQQYILIKKMAEDFFMDVKIMPVPIMREKCGLAMSSRNSYFNSADKESACNLYKVLNNMRLLFKKGETSVENLKHLAIKELIDKNFTVEYVEIMDKGLIGRKTTAETGDIILSAVKFSGVRLIDNIFLE
ncbi:MAG: pantoate--beta-alanine ligase [Candidatus Acididesulfobacter guangdongensis]|uniref:Pantothenate synthetase n=1 Tax=Acididesulfobacter guangdongensis TaxID=2597225 RepID=A0A519BH20_ACIG2|nr:MAG: pantoate--beta-alanine ligase [Candidatus Acididesulfobacter guangdongensis]